MPYLGIDYGAGHANRDPENGIRYGVISQHSISQAWCDSSEPDYGEPTCPKCGNVVKEYCWINSEGVHIETEQYGRGCADYVCEDCKITLDSQDVYGDEAQEWNVDDGEYVMSNCLDSDVIITKSPYYTFAQFCSPCVPGAGNLDAPIDDGVKCYCVNHDWFNEGVAPYPVYRVSDDSVVESTDR